MSAAYDLIAAIHGDAHAILESITDAFYALNANWEFIYVNCQAEETLGRKRADLLGKNIWSLYPGAVGSEFEALFRKTVNQRVAGSATHYYPDHDRWYEVHTYPAKDGLSVYFRNVTERVKAEQALQQSELRYRTLFETIEDGFCIIQVVHDQDGRTCDVRFCETNPTFEKQNGLRQAKGKTLRELLPDVERRWVEIVEQVVATSEPVRFETESKATGRWFEAYAFKFDEPSACKAAILFKDITERRRIERELADKVLHLQVADRRQAFQLELADRIRPLSVPDDVTAIASELLGRHLGVERVVYGSVDSRGKTLVMQRDWTDGTLTSMAGVILQLDDFSPAIAAAVKAGQTLAVEDIEADERSAPFAAAYAAQGVRSYLAIPLMKEGRLRALLSVHRSCTYSWKQEEVTLATDMVDRTWSAVESATAQADLRREHQQSQYIFDSMTEGFALLDMHWNIMQVNAEGLRLTQRTLDEVIGRSHVEVWPELQGSIVNSLLVDARRTGLPGTTEISHVLPDGSKAWIELRVYPSLGDTLAVFFRNITERKATEEKARHASLHDALTGLPNRAMLFEYATHLLSHNRRAKQFAAVLFLDLDRFKPINDTHGHEVGDTVLKQVASRLSDRLRAEDVVVRLGGDEFVVLLQNIKDASFAAEVTRDIVERINEPYHIGELMLSLSTSVGISIFPDDGQDIDILISRADAAMYQAKQAGRNNYQFYSAEFAAGTRMQLEIEQELKSALRNRAFHLQYQPVVELATGKLVSVEALLRWNNARIGPEHFVPVAEATGIINPIGRWVLAEASRQHKAWIVKGLPPIPIAVNVSVVEFRDKDFVIRFQSLIEEQALEPGALQLELTETAVMDDIDHAVVMLSDLRALGVTILLDDFGTGHSSLAYLARLPLDKIKLDKSFISRLDDDLASRAVTDAMLALGRTLNLDMVAEGIESASMLEYIRSRGCQEAQGHFFGKPMSADLFEAWYLDKAAGADSSSSITPLKLISDKTDPC